MLIWYFSNNLDIYEYVGKLPEQHFSVWLFFNSGENILFLLTFNEARISEWNCQGNFNGVNFLVSLINILEFFILKKNGIALLMMGYLAGLII